MRNCVVMGQKCGSNVEIYEREENIVEKAEIAGHQNFLPLSQCFNKSTACRCQCSAVGCLKEDKSPS